MYYIYKLNLEPNVLAAYEFQMDQIRNTVIPSALGEIFDILDDPRNQLLKIQSVDIDIKKVRESAIYLEVIEEYDVFFEMYNNILHQYENTGRIVYSETFMQKRKKLDILTKEFYDSFPELKNEVESMKNPIKVPTFQNVKMGLVYIQRAAKIIKFVSTYNVGTAQSVVFFYDIDKELIYLEDDGQIDSVQFSLNEAKYIESTINNYKDKTNLGQVTINPIYEDVVLEGFYSELTIEIVYPNGNFSRERSDAIRAMNASKETIKYEASKGEKINADNANEIIEEKAKKGYLAAVKSKGRDIMKGKIKTINL